MKIFALRIQIAATMLVALIMLVPAVAVAKPGLCKIVNQTAGTNWSSLQSAVNSAFPGDKLILKGTCYGTTVINKDLELTGLSNPGYGPAALDGQGGGTVVTVDGASVTLRGLTITNGTGQAIYSAYPQWLWGGGLYNDEGVVALENCRLIGNTANEGAGIFNDGKMLVTESIIVDNYGDFGAGIGTDGSLEVLGSTLESNNAPGDGGGIYAYTGIVRLEGSQIMGNYAGWGDGGGIASGSAELLVIDSTISGNYAEGFGGGIAAWWEPVEVISSTISDNAVNWGRAGGIYAYELTMTNSIVSDNEIEAGQWNDSGGGIYVAFKATLTDVTISGNSANTNGGGVGLDYGTVQMFQVTLTGNHAGSKGGGMWNGNAGTASISESTITENSAEVDGGGVYNDGGSVTFANTTFSGNSPNDCGGACP